MTHLQISVLNHLSVRGELSRQGLCQFTGRRITSAVIDPLVASGHVRRENAAWTWYSITDAGREELRETMRRRLIGEEV